MKALNVVVIVQEREREKKRLQCWCGDRSFYVARGEPSEFQSDPHQYIVGGGRHAQVVGGGGHEGMGWNASLTPNI